MVAMEDRTAKQVAISFFELISAGRHEDAIDLLAENCVWMMPASLPGGGALTKYEFLAALKVDMKFFKAQPQYHITESTAEGNRVSVDVTGTGPLNNGSTYDNRYNFVFVVEKGKAIHVREYLDTHYAMNVVFESGAGG